MKSWLIPSLNRTLQKVVQPLLIHSAAAVQQQPMGINSGLHRKGLLGEIASSELARPEAMWIINKLLS